MHPNNCNCPPTSATIVRTPSPMMTPTQMAGKQAFEQQEYVVPWPYYSKVKFRAARVNANPGPYNYVIPANTIVRAFSYGIGEQMLPAGFTALDGPATIADTNLTRRATTTSSEKVRIDGFAIQPLPAALDVEVAGNNPIVRTLDHQLLAALFEAVSVELAVNGDQNRYKLGILGMIPGAGGLTGGAAAMAGRPALAGGVQSEIYPDNGWPVRRNYFAMNLPVTWNKSGEKDSQLEMILTVQRPIQIFSGGAPETNLPAVIAGAGVQAYDYPNTLVCELLVHLAGLVTGERSNVS